MKHYIGRHEARSHADFLELALGTPVELWLGEDDESAQERAARLDAARDIITDDPALFDRVTHVVADLVEARAPELFNVTALRRLTAATRHARRVEVAA